MVKSAATTALAAVVIAVMDVFTDFSLSYFVVRARSIDSDRDQARAILQQADEAVMAPIEGVS